MRLELQHSVLCLEAGQVLSLDGAEGTILAPQGGTVWVTEEGDVRDHIVEPGQTLRIAQAGRAVVQAMQPASVSLHQAQSRDNDAQVDSSYLLQHPEEMIAELRARLAIPQPLTRYYRAAGSARSRNMASP
jgi:hypothetical protein